MPRLPEAFTHDCRACHGLCCIAPQTTARHGFAFEKPPLVPCRHLDSSTFLCAIHDRLAAAGCPGCVDYTCHGAGPLVTAYAVAQGVDWTARAPDDPARREMLERFLELHALFSALAELRGLADGHPALAAALAGFERYLEALTIEALLNEAQDLAFEVRGVMLAAEE